MMRSQPGINTSQLSLDEEIEEIRKKMVAIHNRHTNNRTCESAHPFISSLDVSYLTCEVTEIYNQISTSNLNKNAQTELKKSLMDLIDNINEIDEDVSSLQSSSSIEEIQTKIAQVEKNKNDFVSQLETYKLHENQDSKKAGMIAAGAFITALGVILVSLGIMMMVASSGFVPLSGLGLIVAIIGGDLMIQGIIACDSACKPKPSLPDHTSPFRTKIDNLFKFYKSKTPSDKASPQTPNHNLGLTNRLT